MKLRNWIQAHKGLQIDKKPINSFKELLSARDLPVRRPKRLVNGSILQIAKPSNR